MQTQKLHFVSQKRAVPIKKLIARTDRSHNASGDTTTINNHILPLNGVFSEQKICPNGIFFELSQAFSFASASTFFCSSFQFHKGLYRHGITETSREAVDAVPERVGRVNVKEEKVKIEAQITSPVQSQSMRTSTEKGQSEDRNDLQLIQPCKLQTTKT